MTSESYASVVLDVLKQNRNVGKSLVETFRVGDISLVEKNLSGKLGSRGDKVTNLLIKRRRRSEAVIAKVDGVENKYAAKVFDVLGRISLPGAKMARSLSS